MAVGEIAEQMPVTRPAVSQHLRVLKEAGLVTERREGTRRLYSMDAEGVQAVRAYFDRMWTDALGSYERFAQQLTEPDRPKERKDTT
jgi:DNA-binding transcriptional ArsR family regulator